MNFTFEEAEKKFKSDDLAKLADSTSGYKYLLIRSLGRKENLIFVAEAIKNDKKSNIGDLSGGQVTVRELGKKLFEKNEVDIDKITSFILEINEKQVEERKEHESEIVKELKKLSNYDWGGLYQNNLEQAIVNNYVKKIDNFTELEDKIVSEINPKVKAYTLFSWYNNWSSILIEDIFKRHSCVTPAVGKIKKIDFFINQIPFDLKVTYLPEEYVGEELKKMPTKCKQEYESEINRLSRFCKQNQIILHNNAKIRDYWKAVNSSNLNGAEELILQLVEDRASIIKNAESNPKDLIKWLYENQGQRRFDSSNRIYLVLHDTMNYYDSWKLKSNLEFITEGVNLFLDSFTLNHTDKIKFKYDGSSYEAISKIIILSSPKN